MSAKLQWPMERIPVWIYSGCHHTHWILTLTFSILTQDEQASGLNEDDSILKICTSCQCFQQIGRISEGKRVADKYASGRRSAIMCAVYAKPFLYCPTRPAPTHRHIHLLFYSTTPHTFNGLRLWARWSRLNTHDGKMCRLFLFFFSSLAFRVPFSTLALQ